MRSFIKKWWHWPLACCFVLFGFHEASWAVSPPNMPLPSCVELGGNKQGACTKSSEYVSASVSGRFSEKGTLVVSTAPNVPVCDYHKGYASPHTWSPSPCYASVSAPAVVGCGYIDLADNNRWKETPCSRILYKKSTDLVWPLFTADGTETQASCKGAGDYNTFIWGGAANVAGAKWVERGASFLNCKMTFQGIRPNALRGPTWVKMRVEVGVAKDGDYRRAGRSGSAEVFVPIDGDMISRVDARFEFEKKANGTFQFTNFSKDYAARSLTYSWDFGDGKTSSTKDPSHTYRKPGEYKVTLEAKNSEGTKDSYSRTIRIAALDSFISFDPKSGSVVLEEVVDGDNTKAKHEIIRAMLSIKNMSDAPIPTVYAPRSLSIKSMDRVVKRGRLGFTGGPWDANGQPISENQKISLAANEEYKVFYELTARDEGLFEVQSLATYEDVNTRRTRGSLAKRTLDVDHDALVGIELKSMPELSPEVFVKGGTQTDLDAQIYNLSNKQTIVVEGSTFRPGKMEGNAKFVPFRLFSAPTPASNESCYVSPTKEVEPDDTLRFLGGIKTSDAGSTRGVVNLNLPKLYVLDENGDATPIDLKKIKFIGSDFDLAYRVDVSEEVREQLATDDAIWAGGVTVGFIYGSGEWLVQQAFFVTDLLASLPQIISGIPKKAYTVLINTVKAIKHLYEISKAYDNKAELGKAFGKWVYDKALASGESVQKALQSKELAEAFLPGWTEDIEKAYASGNPFDMGFVLGRGTGYASAEVATCFFQTPKFLAGYKALAAEKVTQKTLKATELLREFNTKVFTNDALNANFRKAVVLGAKVDKAKAVFWGVDKTAFNSLSAYAKANKLIISARERSQGAIARLAERVEVIPGVLKRVWIEKAEFMKLKNVREDVDIPLGYLREHVDIVAFKKVSQSDLDRALQGLIDPDRIDEITKRFNKRQKEWEEWYQKPSSSERTGKVYPSIYDKFTAEGFPIGFQGKTNAAGLNEEKYLPFKLEPVLDPTTGKEIPDYFVPKVKIEENPDVWVGFSGDIDIVDVRHADGRSLSPELARKHMDNLRVVPGVNMQHGDTLSWVSAPNLTPEKIFGIKIEQLESFFDGASDKLLQFSPSGSYAVQIDATKSFVKFGSRSSYVTYVGGHQQWASKVVVNVALPILPNLPRLKTVRPWLHPFSWFARLGRADYSTAEGLDDGVCQARVSRKNGTGLRMDPQTGKFERFTGSEWVPAPDINTCFVGGKSGAFSMLPQTTLKIGASAGDREIFMLGKKEAVGKNYDGDWFKVGDTLTFAPGTEDQADYTIIKLDPMTLHRPLVKSYTHEDLIVLNKDAIFTDEFETY